MKAKINLTKFILKSIKLEHIQIYKVVAQVKYQDKFIYIDLILNMQKFCQDREPPFKLSFNSLSAYFKDENFEVFDEIKFKVDKKKVIKHIENILNK